MTGSAGHAPSSSCTLTLALRLRKIMEYAARKTEHHKGDRSCGARGVTLLYRGPEPKLETARQETDGGEKNFKGVCEVMR